MERIARSPPNNELWDIADVASYLNLNKSVVENKYKPLPGFPRAIRLNGTGHPRY